MKEVTIYGDGACLGNPGIGGWAALLIYMDEKGKRYERMVSGGEANTTNNRMELTAFIGGLRALRDYCNVAIYSDSQLTVNCANGEWGASKNLDLWKDYFELANQQAQVTAYWVKGHAGQPENERVHDESMRQAYLTKARELDIKELG